MSKIKICGLRRPEDVDAVNRYMPDYAGFVLVPGRTRGISHERAAELRKRLSGDIQAVGVFVNEDREKIAALLDGGIIAAAQLHGQETEEDVAWLKERSGSPVIKAVSVKAAEDIRRWRQSAADFLLLDNGAGGTGRAFDWGFLSEITDAEDTASDLRGKKYAKPFFLAGGINRGNLEAALSLRPYGVDISGGVESGGFKDPELIEEVINIVRRYDYVNR